MQISDCRLVGATLQATSHWTRTFWCKGYLFLSQLSDHFKHAANPNIVWRNKQKKKKPETERMWSHSPLSLKWRLVHEVKSTPNHSIIHDMNTKPSWINWVGINLNPRYLDSRECQVQNSRKPPAFKEHSIEGEVVVPTPTFCPSGRVVEMEFGCRLICQLNVSESQNLNQVGLKIQTATPLEGF